jgi:predicted HTH domain antitoxin
MRTVKIELELPEELLTVARIPEKYAPEEIKRIIAFELYRRGVISLGKACRLAGISKWEFFEINKKLQIPINYTRKDWEKDKREVKKMV